MIKEARVFKALSDETRLRIMNLLSFGELCVCDLENILKTTQSKISRHLSYLKNSGLVKDRRENVWIHYSIIDNNSFIKDLITLINKNIMDNEQIKTDIEELHKRKKNKKESC